MDAEPVEQFLGRIDPLSASNLLRMAATIFVDNGDGTLTLCRPQRFESAQPTS